MNQSSVELRDLAVAIAREAGDLILQRRRAGVEVADTKSSATDVVTEADRAAEELIRSLVLRARPDDAILGEEGSAITGSSGVRWILDPIDGTVNYLHGLAHYAVSIGVEADGVVVAGVVLNPASKEEYAAAAGAGATLNGVPLRVRAPVPMAQRLISTGFSYEPEIRRTQGVSVARLLPQIADIRRFGSCALDLCAIAAARSDGYVEEGPNLWDHAAGGLIATEAGARVEVLGGASGQDLVVAAPSEGFGEFLGLIRDCGFVESVREQTSVEGG